MVVYRISGAFFFGATARVSTILDRVGERPGVFILDFSAVPLIDSTGAKALHGVVNKLQRAGTTIYFSGARPTVRRALVAAGLRAPARVSAARIVPTLMSTFMKSSKLMRSVMTVSVPPSPCEKACSTCHPGIRASEYPGPG